MSVLERENITSHINGWKNTLPAQFVEELASLSHETHRIPDPYHYLITPNGELFSSTAGCRVKDAVKNKTSHLGQLEYQALLAIEQWAANNNEGVMVWVSPPEAGVYPVSKIIVSEIEHEEGTKKLFNRAILFDFDEKQCLEFAQNLANFSQDRPLLAHLDQVRATPLILNIRGNFWIHILEELVDDSPLWEMIRKGEDKRLKKEALRQAATVQKLIFISPVLSYTPEAEMAIKQMLGPKPGSCPPRPGSQSGTAFQVFSENSVTYGSSGNKDPDFCRVCPICDKEINCVVRAGGSCPKCGAVKRCG